MNNGEDRDVEQALGLVNSNHQHKSSDAISIRSFASSATLLSTPSSPTEQKYSFEVYEYEIDHRPSSRPTWRAGLSLRRLSSLLCHLTATSLVVLIPSFLRVDRSSKPPRKLHPTSYLDGLRGVAALIVFIDHFIIHWFDNLKFGYGSSDENMYFIQLPIVRLLYSGRASVGVFLVISGFVLSYKPVKIIRSGDIGGLANVLGSSVLRRGLRLYLPVVFGTFISAILAFKGLYLDVPSRAEKIPPQFPTFREQLWNWSGTMTEIIFPFRDPTPNVPYSPPYNGHLWTIPIEFYGSMVVFLVIAALSRTETIYRMLIIGFLAIWALGRERWDVFLFLSGTFLADVNFIAHPSLAPSSPQKSEQEDKLPSIHCSQTSKMETITSREVEAIQSPSLRPIDKTTSHIFQKSKSTLNILLLLTSLFLLSYAGDGLHPGTYHLFLQPLTPTTYLLLWYGQERFWLALGSVLLIFTLTNSTLLQKPFTTPFCQYLGDISYSLYIVHGMVLFTLGTGLMERWTGRVGRLTLDEWGGDVRVRNWGEGEVSAEQFWRAFGVCAVVNFAVIFWAADLFWRGVDRRCVVLARRVEGLLVGIRGD